MNDPITSPWLLYFVGICNGVCVFSFAVALFSGWISGVLFFLLVLGNELYASKIKKLLKVFIPVAIISSTLAIFVPSKDTAIKMYVAAHATTESKEVKK